MRSLAATVSWAWFAACVTLACAGCAGYQVGTRSLYRADVRTVYVPVIQSELFRRNFGERLTEAVVKEIELKTPYKVVHYPEADSVLTGRITSDTKRVLGENLNTEPRVLETALAIEVNWMDRFGNVLMPDVSMPIMPFMLNVSEANVFIPEAGQSIATSHQQTIEQLAREIVQQMEMSF